MLMEEEITNWDDKHVAHPLVDKMKNRPEFFQKAIMELRPDEMKQLLDLMEKLIENRGR